MDAKILRNLMEAIGTPGIVFGIAALAVAVLALVRGRRDLRRRRRQLDHPGREESGPPEDVRARYVQRPRQPRRAPVMEEPDSA